MELNVQQIAENVAARIIELRTQKEKLEAQLKDKLAVVNAQLAELEKLAGIRKRPGKPKGSGKKGGEEKKISPLIGFAKQVLEANPEKILSSAEIVEKAIETRVWENPPKSAKANMARVLKNCDESSGIYRDSDGDYYLKENDNFED